MRQHPAGDDERDDISPSSVFDAQPLIYPISDVPWTQPPHGIDLGLTLLQGGCSHQPSRNYPQFTLVDSVRKKFVAVSDMASELNISNVRIHFGRAEEMKQGGQHAGRYHVVLGRSVTALPNFCSWIQDLLKREGVDGRTGQSTAAAQQQQQQQFHHHHLQYSPESLGI